MLKSKLPIFLFFTYFFVVNAQNKEGKEIEGKVTSADGDVAATHVLNITTQRAAITDSNGFFKISAKRNDTIVFSAVQYQRKEIVITASILESKFITVPLEPVLTKLDEVVIMPYNLTGDMTRDADRLSIEPVVTASTLELPNAYVKPLTKSERILYEATSGGGLIPLNPIINGISGRTKQLKNQVKREKAYARTQRVQAFYKDSLLITDLKIPKESIDDFMYFCEIDSTFQAVVDTHDKLKIWEIMILKSQLYRKNNELD